MKNDNVFLVFDKKAYFYQFEEMCLPPLKKITFTYKLILNLCRIFKCGIPKFMLTPKILNSKNIIITDSAFNYELYVCLRKLRPKKKLILYYMNTIDETNQYLIQYFKEIYTFDFKDAKKYGIKYKHTPYTGKITNEIKDKTYDTLFLGRAKDRLGEIIKLKEELDKLGMVNKFLILDETNAIESVTVLKEFIPYDKYLEILFGSKCIVEINKTGQVGCSLRYLEALFFKKKLITNNKSIINDPYYDYNNMYILGGDNRDLGEFIRTSYKENGRINLQNLFFEKWIETF